MTEFDAATLNKLDPQQFARLIKDTPDSRIREVMAGDGRKTILDGIFSRLPALFRADRAGDTEAVIHWVLTGRPDGGADVYEVAISGGRCVSSSTPTTDSPRLTLTMAPTDFLKVITRAGNPMMMFMTGKVKAKGDLGLAAHAASLFDMPKA
ncbi:SCP2 sterol-binding domain-containing protein [Pilimelia columellifera]|uniref:SCP2 domain-containing protein n=1 Tax=Pilimelia columellifera subsp. columellifera TaxID=706583 RepID=A0ABN3N236_9ACTN